MKNITLWIFKLLAAILGIVFGIFLAPIAFVFFTFCLLLMWFGVALMCLVLPFYMGIEAMNEVKA
jgi:hypothetical protein